MLKPKYKLSEVPVFTFSLPVGAIRPSASHVSYATDCVKNLEIYRWRSELYTLMRKESDNECYEIIRMQSKQTYVV